MRGLWTSRLQIAIALVAALTFAGATAARGGCTGQTPPDAPRSVTVATTPKVEGCVRASPSASFDRIEFVKSPKTALALPVWGRPFAAPRAMEVRRGQPSAPAPFGRSETKAILRI